MKQVIQGRTIPLPVVHEQLILTGVTEPRFNSKGIPEFHLIVESFWNSTIKVIIQIEAEKCTEGFTFGILHPALAKEMIGFDFKGSIVDTGHQFIYIP